MTQVEKKKIQRAIHLIANTERFEDGMEILFRLCGMPTKWFKIRKGLKGIPITEISTKERRFNVKGLVDVRKD